MKILDFFQGVFSFPVSSDMVRSACYMREYDADEEMEMADTKTQELIMADILVMLSRASQGYTNKSGSDAFSMTMQGEYIPLTDRRAMRNEANKIYRKYNELEKVQETNAVNIF
jgi:hypothetical protein